MDALTDAEKSLDLETKLAETNGAITFLSAMGSDIPAEAMEIRTILRRAIFAERAKCDECGKDLLGGGRRGFAEQVSELLEIVELPTGMWELRLCDLTIASATSEMYIREMFKGCHHRLRRHFGLE